MASRDIPACQLILREAPAVHGPYTKTTPVCLSCYAKVCAEPEKKDSKANCIARLFLKPIFLTSLVVDYCEFLLPFIDTVFEVFCVIAFVSLQNVSKAPCGVSLAGGGDTGS